MRIVSIGTNDSSNATTPIVAHPTLKLIFLNIYGKFILVVVALRTMI